ncbi:plasmid replication/partition related protein [Paucibacter soli]|uniref:plasmid replication/partition related protein n=1 Tax=Paucibacter soli TaxID=3133433 RepID=UPI0030AE61ED
MNIVVNEELKAYIDPLTPDEHAALERSILAEGCRDALVLWGEVLVDGHNRYGICVKHGLPFQTVQNPRFKSIEDVHLWMIDQHLGRRSVSDFQRGVLALRKKEIVAARRAQALHTEPDESKADAPQLPPVDPLNTREAIARAARISSNQVVLIEKIQKQAAPELVAAVKSGEITISAAAAVASLPVEEQVAAASAGKSELKQAAKRARAAKAKPAKAAEQAGAEPAEEAAAQDLTPPTPLSESEAEELQRLRQRVAELTVENAVLRQQLSALQR